MATSTVDTYWILRQPTYSESIPENEMLAIARFECTPGQVICPPQLSYSFRRPGTYNYVNYSYTQTDRTEYETLKEFGMPEVIATKGGNPAHPNDWDLVIYE